MKTAKISQGLLGIGIGAAALLGSAGEVSAYCPVGISDTGVPQYTFDAADLPVPVYLVSSGATVLGQSTTQVERAVGRAVDVVNRYGMSAFSLRYGGTLTPAQSAVHPGPGVFVSALSDCAGCPGGKAAACMFDPDVDGAGHIQRADIGFVYNEALCPGFDWQFYPDYAGCVPGACADDIQGPLTHELLHAAGLAHSGSSGNCTPGDNGSEGVMSGNGGTSNTEQRNPSKDDVDGLVSLYGRRLGTLDYHYSYDGGLTWSNGSLLGSTASRSALSSVSTATEGETDIFFGYQANAASWIPYSRSMDEASVSSVSQIGALAVYHPQPVAYGNGTLMAARFTDATRTNNSKTLRWAWSTDEGASWSGADAELNNGGAIRTRRDGLSVAYDPKTVKFIAAYVGDDNAPDGSAIKCDDTVQGTMCDEVRVVTLDPVSGDQRHTSLGVRTSVAPTIVCGDSVGSRNCVVSWVSTTGNACVHWGHGRILADGSFELHNDLSTGCIMGYGPVMLSYDDTDVSKPWRMALTQEVVGNDNRIYTFRKGTGYADAWTDQRSFTVTNDFRILGGVGFLRTAGGAEKLQVMYLRE